METVGKALEFLSMIWGYLKWLGNQILDFGWYTLQAIGDVIGLFDKDIPFNQLWQTFPDYVHWLGNFVILKIADFMLWVAGMLPSIELPTFAGTLSSIFVQAFNWVFPLEFAFQCVGVYLVSCYAWVSVGVLMRWVKLVT